LRFYFFANEEPRMHIHIVAPGGEAKFWVEPIVALAMSKGFSKKEVLEMQRIVEKRQDEIEEAWKKFFKKTK
jgi:hypothetical protein